ncbi:MAG TPA: DUF2330 domain-containing protein [Polyangium sp.]|nr:DUF2330 domain-containing protein [Polyangium sp.]
MSSSNTNRFVGLAFAVATTLLTPQSQAFCGFFVSGAGRTLYNDATFVVIARAGDQTVLSMQNSYQGPPEDFAMVVPVPVILQKEDVKILPDDAFDRVDRLTAPRLVEYWEQNPCAGEKRPGLSWAMSRPDDRNKELTPQARVVVEAEFTVGEYEIVILSAGDSTALDTWLRDHQYKIPAGAEPVLRPYVTNGSKFFVAKVNASKVRFLEGRAMLSPLRFQYASQEFSLPVRLGLLNSSGMQDLIAIVLGSKRFEAANYKNVFMPTNIEVDDSVRNHFGEFYTGLFDRVLAKTPGAIVTEYAWEPGSCDPCPEPPLSDMDLKRLTGGLVPLWDSVITRLHYRYDKNSLGEDLVLRSAPAMTGGRGVWDEKGLSQKAEPSHMDAFQSRFIIRHPWPGAVTCANPTRNEWGGPPEGVAVANPAAATELATVDRKAVDVTTLLRIDVPELELRAPVIAVPEKRSSFRRGLSMGAIAGILVTLVEILRRQFQKA